MTYRGGVPQLHADLDLARSVLRWISGEGQRNCERWPGAVEHCPESEADNPELWCDVCAAGAALWTIDAGQHR